MNVKDVFRKAFYRFAASDEKQLIAMVQSYDIVSFDIFDTLIKRNVSSPAVVFDVMERGLGERGLGFARIRREAERIARDKKPGREVTLDDIYKEVGRLYDQNGTDGFDTGCLKELEINTELQLCCPNLRIRDVYEWCIRNKRVLLISDMYLPRETIIDILKRCKLSVPEEVYISCECKASKASGELYGLILNELSTGSSCGYGGNNDVGDWQENGCGGQYGNACGARIRSLIGDRKWIHVGDSIKGDYLNPRELGLSSALIDRFNKTPELYGGCRGAGLFLDYLSSFVSNHEPFDGMGCVRGACGEASIHDGQVRYDKCHEYGVAVGRDECEENYRHPGCDGGIGYEGNGYERIGYEGICYEKIGYQLLGPLLTGFSVWLNEMIDKGKYSRVFFLARDGRMLLDAYETLFGKNNECVYFHISRGAAISSVIDLLRDFKEMCDLLAPKDFDTLEDLCTAAGADADFVASELNMPAVTLINKVPEDKRELIFKSVKKNSGIDSKRNRKLLKEYVNLFEIKGSVAVVDIGWEGRTQWVIDKILPGVNVEGLYMGVITKCPELIRGLKMHSFWGHMSNIDRKARVIMESVALFETLFLTSEGTTLGYEYDRSGKVKPAYARPDHDSESREKIRNMQEAALRFVTDVRPDVERKIVSESGSDNERLFYRFWQGDAAVSEALFGLYEKIATNPPLEVIKLFRNFKFRDVEICSIGAEHSALFYLLHPKKFFRDFKNSRCRVFFLKDVTRLPLPFFDILYWYYGKRHSAR